MAKKSPTTLPFRKFFGEYASAIEKAHAREERQRNGKAVTLRQFVQSVANGEFEPCRLITSADLRAEVEQWWPIRLIREAAEAGDVEGCKRLLHYFLLELQVPLPDGVLRPFRWKRGRPKETEGIYASWIERGRPALTWRVCEDLTKNFYPEEFARAKSNPNLRKKLRDRVRATIARHQQVLAATKPAGIS